MLGINMADPGILCYQHCGPKVFCLALSEKCPCCSMSLGSTNMKLPPFRLPYPFVEPRPCSIILKPTEGDFLNDYYNFMDLHIGVTTSTGVIVEYDKDGIRRTYNKGKNSPWAQSLLVDTICDGWMEHWDAVLDETCMQKRWLSDEYQEITHNCYTFVLAFLRNLNYSRLSSAAQSKTLFCEKYICPRTTAAGKYISLYRKIRDNGHYIHPTDKTV
ncbi:MKRN2 opposite strand protein [Pseudolycoriella hygida]|uniref:MKRN2 opposite strand protein n=1 Tax=Pseudolycoriella hygida TaxID=35572 RepID=A0A9Q0NBQ1_9DIPT|nr:MKRN2 opposite strand protein [Pseudolycoriella hygida]